MKKIFLMALLTAVAMLVSCSQETIVTVRSEQESASSSIHSEADETLSEIDSLQITEDETEESSSAESVSSKSDIGGFYSDGRMAEKYSSVDVKLINHVGSDVMDDWMESGSPFTIVSFVNYTGISKSAFMNIMRPEYDDATLQTFRNITGNAEMTMSQLQDRLGYTLEEIDAIYSGDQAEVNRVFCGPLGVYNEQDGEVYGVQWLAGHTAEEYIEIGLPMDRVAEVLTLAQEEYASTSVAELAESAESTLTEALALEEAAEAAVSAE